MDYNGVQGFNAKIKSFLTVLYAGMSVLTHVITLKQRRKRKNLFRKYNFNR